MLSIQPPIPRPRPICGGSAILPQSKIQKSTIVIHQSNLPPWPNLPLHNSTFNLHPFPTMTDIASHPPQSPRFRRDRPVLERRAGAWLRDFTLAAAEPGFTIPAHLEKLAKPAQTP
jgi:hypothetical protein